MSGRLISYYEILRWCGLEISTIGLNVHPIDKRMVCFKQAENITRSTVISCHILNDNPRLDVSCDNPLKPINIKG